MRNRNLFGLLVTVAAAAGCGSSSSNDNNINTSGDMAQIVTPPDMTTTTCAFKQPTGTVAVSFTVDDTANKVYAQGDLEWKGSMIYDPVARTATKDAMWTGPWAKLWDDGPYTPPTCGHEPANATKGDNKWGVTIFVKPPAMGTDTFEYGLIDRVYEDAYGNGWIWKGSNGTFAVPSGSTTAVTAAGLTLVKFGTTDIQLTLDTKNLDKVKPWDTTFVGVKGNSWAWGVQQMTVDGTGKAVFTLGANIGATGTFKHTGLLNSGDKPEFIFVLGPAKATALEYKDAGGNPLLTGVSAAVKASGASSWSPVTVMGGANKANTYITVP